MPLTEAVWPLFAMRLFRLHSVSQFWQNGNSSKGSKLVAQGSSLATVFVSLNSFLKQDRR